MQGIRLKYIFSFLLLLSLAVLNQPVLSQVTPDQARQMLSERGVPEDTLRARLIKKGYDPDNIKPEQVSEFQKVVLETINEIEAEQKIAQPPQPQTPIETFDVKAPAPEEVAKEAPKDVVELPPVDETFRTPIYGQEIFRNNSIAIYQKSDEITPPDDYILGVGDKLGVVGFGTSQFDQILEIRADGFVQPGRELPRILLKGVRFVDAKELLYQRFRQYYSVDRSEFQVSLNNPRNISVNVFGETKTTGTFTLPAFNTAFNILSAAGGPTDIGSVRRIKIISGSNVRMLDVYEFMHDPAVAKNFFLQNNDYIHVPIAEKVVEIQGAITRPMAYELLDSENLVKLIEYAGGLRPNSYLSDVKITRFLADRQIITDVNFRELVDHGGDYILYNGDKIEIKTIESIALNYVSVAGAVFFDGQFERKSGMRISDLLNQSKLRPEARLDFASLLRYQPDSTYRYERINLQTILDNPSSSENRLLNDGDQIQVMTLQSYIDKSTFSVSGAVRNPKTFDISPDGNLKLEDVVLLAGGLSPDALDYGYIIRMDPYEPKTAQYIPINLKDALNAPESSANIEIKAGDEVLVFGKSELRDSLNVFIYGAVRKPGSYMYGPNMSVSDLINLAGGFTYGADHSRIDVARIEFTSDEGLKINQYTTQLPQDFGFNNVSGNRFPLAPYDNVYVRSIPEFEFQKTITIKGEVLYPGEYPILRDNEKISDLIERAGGLTGEAFPQGAKLFRQGDTTGLVVINLHEILQNNNIPSNVTLLAGDIIDVPKHRDLVTIEGHVNLEEAYSKGFLTGQNKISVAFRGEKNAKYYVDNFAAGVSKTGSPEDIKVEYADGGAEKTRKFFFFNQYPKVKRGSTIIVGPKEVKTTVAAKKEKEEVDWGIVLRDTLTQVTAVLTILILVDQLGQ